MLHLLREPERQVVYGLDNLMRKKKGLLRINMATLCNPQY